jgi:hypothetical protein
VEEERRLSHGWNFATWTAEQEQLPRGNGQRQNKHAVGEVLGTELKRYVTFYFTNFPAQLSNFYLRKGFEVCGMLEDVFVPNKRNRNGEPYGFVKFANVRDVSKMTKALNAVWFGHFRIRASVAKFERNVTKGERRLEVAHDGLSKGVDDSVKKDGNCVQTRHVEITDGGAGTRPTMSKKRSGGAGDPVPEVEGPGVQVGDIVLHLGGNICGLTDRMA